MTSMSGKNRDIGKGNGNDHNADPRTFVYVHEAAFKAGLSGQSESKPAARRAVSARHGDGVHTRTRPVHAQRSLSTTVRFTEF